MTTTPFLGATDWAAAQASPWLPHNAAIRLAEALARAGAIEDRDLAAPPGSCADGACYLIAAGPTGAWVGKAGQLAVAVGINAASGWLFIVAAIEGTVLWVKDEDLELRYNGAAWVTAAGGATLDTDGTLAANSDARIATQKATRTYVDAKVAGLSWKVAVRAATTVTGALASAFANGATIDGVVLSTGDRILIKNQAAGAENGIYTVNASGEPTRASDADSSAELVNAAVYVSEGTTLADTQWTCSTNAPITVGTTALVFAQFVAGGYTDAQARAAVNIAPTTQAGTAYTAALGDAGGYIQFTNAAAIAFTIPPNSTVAFAIGTVITAEQNGAGVVTLTAGAGVTLRSRGTLVATAGQYAVAQVKKVATDIWTIIGDVA